MVAVVHPIGLRRHTQTISYVIVDSHRWVTKMLELLVLSTMRAFPASTATRIWSMLKNSIPGKTLYNDLSITKLANFGFKQSGRDYRDQRNGKTGTIRNSVKKTLTGIFGRMATKSRLRVSTYSFLLNLKQLFRGHLCLLQGWWYLWKPRRSRKAVCMQLQYKGKVLEFSRGVVANKPHTPHLSILSCNIQ